MPPLVDGLTGYVSAVRRASVLTVGLLAPALAVGFATAALAAQAGQAYKWETTDIQDIWGDPTGIDLISTGTWHERGSAKAEDPLFVVRCRKGQPIAAHVDWRQFLAPRERLFYEVHGGPRLEAPTQTDSRGFVLMIPEPHTILLDIEEHSFVALFSRNRQGQSVSATFYVDGIVTAARKRCDLSAQESRVPDRGPPPLPSEQVLDTSRPIYVTGDTIEPELVSRVEPEYSKKARAARVQGVVILQATINTSGEITDVKVVKGLPMGLNEAAVAALKQWKFKPATLDGSPVAVYYNTTVNFQLQ